MCEKEDLIDEIKRSAEFWVTGECGWNAVSIGQDLLSTIAEYKRRERKVAKLKDEIARLKVSLLSEREREIMQDLAKGARVINIAKKYNLNVKTVYTYRARLLKKLELKNDVEVAHFVLKHGLMEDLEEA